jgi:hypothetical protein
MSPAVQPLTERLAYIARASVCCGSRQRDTRTSMTCCKPSVGGRHDHRYANIQRR